MTALEKVSAYPPGRRNDSRKWVPVDNSGGMGCGIFFFVVCCVAGLLLIMYQNRASMEEVATRRAELAAKMIYNPGDHVRLKLENQEAVILEKHYLGNPTAYKIRINRKVALNIFQNEEMVIQYFEIKEKIQ